MSTDDPGLTGDPESLTQSIKRAKEDIEAGGHRDHGAMQTVRESSHRGHHIVVRTTYEITVDDKPVEGHLGVTNGGQVHYHPVPNLGFASAIELVETLIDTFPDDFDPPAAPPPDHDAGHAAHDHGNAGDDDAPASHDHGHG